MPSKRRNGAWEAWNGWNDFGSERAQFNLLGVREPEIYGRETLEDIKQRCIARATVRFLPS